MLPETFNLKQETIDKLKAGIANRENMLIEDVSDQMVWDYLRDFADDDGILTHGSNNPDDWEFIGVHTLTTAIDSITQDASCTDRNAESCI